MTGLEEDDMFYFRNKPVIDGIGASLASTTIALIPTHYHTASSMRVWICSQVPVMQPNAKPTLLNVVGCP